MSDGFVWKKRRVVAAENHGLATIAEPGGELVRPRGVKRHEGNPDQVGIRVEVDRFQPLLMRVDPVKVEAVVEGSKESLQPANTEETGPEEEALEHLPEPEADPEDDKAILLVDDEEDLVTFLSHRLLKRGYTVTAKTAVSARFTCTIASRAVMGPA